MPSSIRDKTGTDHNRGREIEKIFFLERERFNVGNLIAKEVGIITIGDSNIVECIGVVFEGKCYSDLKRILAEKYEVVRCKEPFVGDCHCILKAKGNSEQSIFILQEHLSFDTVVGYYTNKYDEARHHVDEAEARKREAEIENTL